MFGLRSSRNAKNRPSKRGELYGDNINSVVGVADELAVDFIPLDSRVSMMDFAHTSMVKLKPKDGPIMGVEVPDRVLDTEILKRLKLEPDVRFDVSVQGDRYVLDSDTFRYDLPLREDLFPRKGRIPNLSKDEKTSVCIPIDTAIFGEMYMETKREIKKTSRTPTKDLREATVEFVSGPEGVTAQVMVCDQPFGDIRILSREPAVKECVATYSLGYLRSFMKANPNGRIWFDGNRPIIFGWDDPTYEGRMAITGIRSKGDDYDEQAYERHGRAFLSKNRRPGNSRRRNRR